jgi:hypothetical protein
MSNVFDITPHLPDRPALDVDIPLAIAERMLQVGSISRHAFGIAALAISRMQQAGEYACVFTRQDLVGAYVMLDGAPLASVNGPEIHELAGALHALQAYCGLYNHVKQDRVGKGTVRHNHFSEKYRGDGDYEPMYRITRHDTPIYMVWLPEQADQIIADAKATIEHKMIIARWSNITTTGAQHAKARNTDGV